MILEFVRNHLILLGILEPHNGYDHNGNSWFIYFRNGFVFISLAVFTIPTFCYFLFEAATFNDSVNSFFFTSCGILGMSFYAVLLRESDQIHYIIVKLEETFELRSIGIFLFCVSNTELNLINEFILFSIVNLMGISKNGISSRKKNSIGKNSLWWYRQCNWNPNEIFTYNYVKDFGSSYCIAVHNVVVRGIFLVWIFQQLVSIDLSVGVSVFFCFKKTRKIFVSPRMENGFSHFTSWSGLQKFA